MPPTNDNWANATVLSTANSGSLAGNNFGATSEVGEPVNNGRTVWYSWTPAVGQQTYFSTLSTGFVVSPLRTKLQVFKQSGFPIDVAHMAEITYLPNSGNTVAFNNWDYGSRVGLYSAAGTTYWIRVDGVAGLQGNFTLSWGEFARTQLGCNNCPMDVDDMICEGAVIPDVTANSNPSFGTFARGIFLVRFVGGAFNVGIANVDVDGVAIPWTVFLNVVSAGNHSEYTIHYFLATVATAVQLGNRPPANPNSVGGLVNAWRNQQDAQTAFFSTCAGNQLKHSGGAISVEFTDTFYGDNMAGSPSPTFCLTRLVPKLSFRNTCASWTSVGSAATCDFNITNLYPVEWDSVTATLDTFGGISGASTVTGITINPLGDPDATVTITFGASTTLVTARLRLSCADWLSDFVVDIYLGPVIIISKVNKTGQSGSVINYDAIIKNLGFWTINVVTTLTLSGGLTFDVSGTQFSTVTSGPTSLDCNGLIAVFFSIDGGGIGHTLFGSFNDSLSFLGSSSTAITV